MTNDLPTQFSVSDLGHLATRLQTLHRKWPRYRDLPAARAAEEAQALATALVDIEESIVTLTTIVYPRLAQSLCDDKQLWGCLWDLRHEIEHVLWHVFDSDFLRDALPPHVGAILDEAVPPHAWKQLLEASDDELA